jgi:glutaredoxin-like protein NrdH
MPRVTLYSLSTCAVCKKVKTFLNENNITYELIEVDMLDSGEQWLAAKEVKKHNPQGTYPTVIVEEVITGYDEMALKEMLVNKKLEG